MAVPHINYVRDDNGTLELLRCRVNTALRIPLLRIVGAELNGAVLGKVGSGNQ